MVYENILPGIFRKRPNRFIAEIEIDGKLEICHVKNTGRCRELLIDGVQVFIQESNYPLRKTKFDLIGVKKGEKLINMDSQAPNKVFAPTTKPTPLSGQLCVRPRNRAYKFLLWTAMLAPTALPPLILLRSAYKARAAEHSAR